MDDQQGVSGLYRLTQRDHFGKPYPAVDGIIGAAATSSQGDYAHAKREGIYVADNASAWRRQG